MNKVAVSQRAGRSRSEFNRSCLPELAEQGSAVRGDEDTAFALRPLQDVGIRGTLGKVGRVAVVVRIDLLYPTG